MSLPVIGVTTSSGHNRAGRPIVTLGQSYTAAVIQAGGVPVLIPSDLDRDGLRALVARLDGVLFTGGGDIAIERFNGQDHPRIGGVDPARDRAELELLHAVVADGTPFLGICRGLQLVNVGLGGTLYTDLADQLPGAIRHDYSDDFPRDRLSHAVRLRPGSRLAQVLGESELQVNSLHHQGLKQLAPGIEPAAYSSDELVEGLELPGARFGLAVQWHPEELTAGEPARRLFRAFVQAAGERA